MEYEKQQSAPLKEGSMWGKAYEYLCIVARFGGFAAVNEAKYAPLVMQVCYFDPPSTCSDSSALGQAVG